MIVLSWNIRGLNSRGKQRYLQDRIRKEKPNIVVIQETKMESQQLETLINKLKIGYEVMALDAVATTGGLAILWNPEEIVFDHWFSLPRILSGVF